MGGSAAADPQHVQDAAAASRCGAAPTGAAPQPDSQSGAAPSTGAFEGTALVTGAAGGIGRAVVHLLLSRGATVIAVDRPEGVISPPDEAGVDGLPPDPKLVPVAVDLADEDATRNTLREVLRSTAGAAGLQACICVAGGDIPGLLNGEDIPDPTDTPGFMYESYWRVNFLTPATVVSAVMPAVLAA
jgi:NAD(P)-dependent dehydrogenase (short-subunit alcohol dehydrogenase family)